MNTNRNVNGELEIGFLRINADDENLLSEKIKRGLTEQQRRTDPVLETRVKYSRKLTDIENELCSIICQGIGRLGASPYMPDGYSQKQALMSRENSLRTMSMIIADYDGSRTEENYLDLVRETRFMLAEAFLARPERLSVFRDPIYDGVATEYEKTHGISVLSIGDEVEYIRIDPALYVIDDNDMDSGYLTHLSQRILSISETAKTVKAWIGESLGEEISDFLLSLILDDDPLIETRDDAWSRNYLEDTLEDTDSSSLSDSEEKKSYYAEQKNSDICQAISNAIAVCGSALFKAETDIFLPDGSENIESIAEAGDEQQYGETPVIRCCQDALDETHRIIGRVL